MKNKTLPMNLQIFAGDPPADPEPAQEPQSSPATPQIDYDKIAQLVSGKQAAAEESVIKGYLKQQGLTKEQMEQAIDTFKQQQAANTPDVNAIQQQLAHAQELAQRKEVENAAILQAMQLGLDVKTIPYALKMADLGKVVAEEGKINEEALKNALNKVLEDVPALKPQTSTSTGFVQVGASGSGQQQTNTDDALKKAFGL